MTPLSQKPSDLGVGESVDGALLRLDGVHQHPRAERHLVCRRVVAGLEEVGGLEQQNVGGKDRNSVSSPSKITDVVFEKKARRSTYVPKSFPLWPVCPVCGPLEGRLTPVYFHIWYGTCPI